MDKAHASESTTVKEAAKARSVEVQQAAMKRIKEEGVDVKEV